MAVSDGKDLTDLLRAWANGDGQALEELTPHVYGELHRLAHMYMAGERRNHPLQSTALINEAYIRLIRWKDVRWQSRTHFFAMAAKLMRRALLDVARSQRKQKRGGGAADTTFDEAFVFRPERPQDLIELDEALTELDALDPRKSRIVELRFFAGLSVQETASAMGLSERTVLRNWSLARAWLRLELQKKAKAATSRAQGANLR
jgi:RNA polymerase sigma factor (TIGR02999 family)